jgi:hypothetical protein
MSTEMFVTSESPLYKHVVEYIHKVWGSKDYFPGPQPISIEYKHFPVLKGGEYVVCEKTDGERHMMVATTFEGKSKCLFVNRAFDMFEVKINLNKKAYEGTILDGELYDNTLMVYDALLVCGEPVGHLNLYGRLQAAEKLMKFIIYMKFDKHRLKLKKFHTMRDFDHFMYEYLPKIEQKIDGLVFTPVNEPMRIGTHETMFKWKPREKNTVDFHMKRGESFKGVGQKGEPVWKLYVQEKGKLFYESEFPISRMNEPWFEDGAIVECMYITWEEGPLWWKPLKRRRDKNHPNNRRTFYRTIVNIKEDIQMKEFLDCRPEHSAPQN